MRKGRRIGAASWECPHCGQRLRAGALACPECGSDARTGWSDEDESFAEEGFDYEDFLAREGLGGRKARAPRGRRVLGAIALALVILWLLRMSGC